MIDPALYDCETPASGHPRDWSIREDLEEARLGWGANVVRVPVVPSEWTADWRVGGGRYDEMLDAALEAAVELDLALIIDWHGFGNLQEESLAGTGCSLPAATFTEANEPGLETTLAFWDHVAERYRGREQTIYYEIFNEPRFDRPDLGLDWDAWADAAEEIVDLIRRHDEERVVLVAGTEWGYDLSGVLARPIADDRVAYVTHPYPGYSRPSCGRRIECVEVQDCWDRAFGVVAQSYPVFVTEWGFDPLAPDCPETPFQGHATGYGERLVSYLGERRIGWTAWSFSTNWHPALLEDWQGWKVSAPFGSFVRSVLLAKARSR